jgi:MFS family permease
MAFTITSLITVPVGIISGIIAPKVGYKKLAFIGLIIAIAGGFFPFFLSDTSNFVPIMISRVILGLGLGMVNPLGAAIIASTYDDADRARYLGLGNLVFFFSGIFYQLLGGFLATLGWNYSFLAVLVTLVSLLLAFFLKEPPKSAVEDKKDMPKEKLPLGVYGYAIFFLLVVVCTFPAVLQISTVLANGGLGDSGTAGIIGSVFQIGGMVGGVSFAIALKLLGRRTLSVYCLTSAIGFAIMFFGSSVWIIGLGIVLTGFGLISFLTGAQYYACAISPKSKLGFTAGLMQAALNLGTFLASFYVSATMFSLPELGEKAPWITSIGAFIVLAAIWFAATFIIKKPGKAEADV